MPPEVILMYRTHKAPFALLLSYNYVSSGDDREKRPNPNNARSRLRAAKV